MLEDCDWKAHEVKAKDERKASCHVSPDGKWYNVAFAHHFKFTIAIAKQLYGYKGSNDREAEKIIMKKGWIWITDDFIHGTVVHNSKKMSLEQYKVLKESFGNQPLFRGWTIDALYDEARSN